MNLLPPRMWCLIPLLTLASLAGPPAELKHYEPTWKTPGQDASDSMPIGNGELAANVWIESNGDVRVLLARTDAWSETSRLLKLGQVTIRMTPPQFVPGSYLVQSLSLDESPTVLALGGNLASLSVSLDGVDPVLMIHGDVPTGATNRLERLEIIAESWRTNRITLAAGEKNSSWTMRDAPMPLIEDADRSPDLGTHRLAWYHRNTQSVWALSMQHQGLASLTNRFSDPLLYRSFGYAMETRSWPGRDQQPDTITKRGNTFVIERPVRPFMVKVWGGTVTNDTADQWPATARRALEAYNTDNEAPASWAATTNYWNDVWSRCWIFIEGDQANAIPTNAHPLSIGRDVTGGSAFRGKLVPIGLTGTGYGFKAGVAPQVVDRALGKDELPTFFPDPAMSLALDLAAGSVPKALASAAWPRGLTLIANIKPVENESGRIYDKITPGGADGFLLDTWPGNSLRLIVGHETLQATNCLKPGVWQQVAASIDAVTGAKRIILDGKVVAENRDEDAPPSRLTQAWILQRWVTTCAGRGNYPIKFNGSLFTVEPKHTDGSPWNADYRKWGDCYWWQNTRLPYGAMAQRGDFEQMRPLFKYYADCLPICRERTKIYYGAEGVYFPETMTMSGLYGNGDYGWGKHATPGDVHCAYWRWAWNQGPELVQLMLDYVDYTDDAVFAKNELVPMAREVLKYFDTRFPRDANGKLAITPAQAVETYWHGVTNDTPTLAGLHAILPALLALPKDLMSETDAKNWKRQLAELAPIPTEIRNGVRVIAPATAYSPRRSNVENPDLYAIYPFRLYGVGKPDLELARNTYARRHEKSVGGWQYAGMVAAMCGLTDEAKRIVLANARNSHRNFRFPVMWGPNYDWLPDQDHGSNLMNTLQLMLLQAWGEKIHVLPAWPREWNVKFKLHAPHRTTVEVEYRDGRLAKLDVQPPTRRSDVVLPDFLQGSARLPSTP